MRQSGASEQAGSTGDLPAIAVRGVTKVFGDGAEAVTALNQVSVDIRTNEFFTLLGPSGCGKTTLLRMIAGFEHPTEGQIRLNGADIAHLPPNKRPVNTVFQSYALFPHMSVARNIGFGLEMQGRPKAEIQRSVEKMLALVKMEAMAKRATSQISGGQQQRVALARALAPHPQVLLLDEPLSALDLKLRKEMQGELKRLQHETGITFVFVTHDQEEALTMSDRIAVMDAGQILQVGTPLEVYNHPADRFVADFIGDTNFLTGRIAAVTAGVADVALACGTRLAASLPVESGAAEGTGVTIVIRPEHASLTSDGATMVGRVVRFVYFGTDTLVHLMLATGELFTVRVQNRHDRPLDLEEGAECGICIEAGAAQVLRD